MQNVTIVIPNLNGMKYLEKCLNSLRGQSVQTFHTILIDNGSDDGSVEFVRENYPEVELCCFPENRGFCAAVNEGIRRTETPYVILLNNDTLCETGFVEALVRGIEQDTKCFSCGSRMLQMKDIGKMDNAGDFYCALGWAFARGKGKDAARYDKRCEIFSACAGAAIYRRSIFDEIGVFDEVHFAYLEDVDLAYRARIAGYRNYYIPDAVVYHVGSATSGSVYNEFKIRYSSRNSIYLIYKNMPFLQILLNLPFLIVGFIAKLAFFAKKGFFRQYLTGLWKGIGLCKKDKKVTVRKQNFRNYLRIQWELWVNIIRRFSDF